MSIDSIQFSQYLKTKTYPCCPYFRLNIHRDIQLRVTGIQLDGVAAKLRKLLISHFHSIQFFGGLYRGDFSFTTFVINVGFYDANAVTDLELRHNLAEYHLAHAGCVLYWTS